MYYHEPLDDAIKRIRSLGEMMIPYNPPNGPIVNEEILSSLKFNEFVIDGYEVCIYYNKSDFKKYFSENLQIYAKYSSFLPFCLICKIAKKFLGEQELSLVEIFRNSKKIYCWNLMCDKEGNPIPLPEQIETESCEFEGLRYAYMQPHQINLY